jgi:hypothetical protein
MPHCIKESEYNPSIHTIVSGPHTLEECLENCKSDPINFSVSNSGLSSYLIDGNINPTLTLQRGLTYTFTINSVGHPFWIKTTQTTGTSNSYNDGVTNNGTSSGMITFEVPQNAPETLYYICQFHGSMTGIISIIDSLNALGSKKCSCTGN